MEDETGVTPGDVVDQQVQKNQAEEAARQEAPDFGQILEALGVLSESMLSLKDSFDRSMEQRQEPLQEPERGEKGQPEALPNSPEPSVSLEPLIQVVRDLVNEVKGWKDSGADSGAKPASIIPLSDPVSPQPRGSFGYDNPELDGGAEKPPESPQTKERAKTLAESVLPWWERDEEPADLPQPTEPAKEEKRDLPTVDMSPVVNSIESLIEEVRSLKETFADRSEKKQNSERPEPPLPVDQTPQDRESGIREDSSGESGDGCCEKITEAIYQLTEVIRKLQETTEKSNEESRSAEEQKGNQSAESDPVKPEAGGFGFSEFSRDMESPEKPNRQQEQPAESRSSPIPSWQMQGPKQFPAQQARQPTPAPRPASNAPGFTSPMESQDQPNNSAVEKFQQVSQGMQKLIGTLTSQQGQIVEMSQIMLGLITQTQARLDQMGSQIAQLTQAARGTGSRAQRNGRV